MAIKAFYHDFDLAKVSQITNARIQNITNANMTTLASTLTAANTGLLVWNTDVSQQYYWSGTAFVAGVATVVGAMVYQGTYASLITTPASPAVGYMYVLTATGTLTWATQTFSPSAVVVAGDQAIYRGANVWDILQGDSIETSTTALGTSKVALQTEVNAGTDATHAVVSSTLASFVATKAFAKVYFNASITTVANTALTITHGLGLQNLNSYTASVKTSTGGEVSVEVDSVSVNTFTITTAVALTTANITVIGF